MKGLPSSVIEGIQIKPMGWLGDEGLIHLNLDSAVEIRDLFPNHDYSKGIPVAPTPIVFTTFNCGAVQK